VLQLNERGSRQSCLDGGSGGDLAVIDLSCTVLLDLYIVLYEYDSSILTSIISLSNTLCPSQSREISRHCMLRNGML
jgi:hypothetical protein